MPAAAERDEGPRDVWQHGVHRALRYSALTEVHVGIQKQVPLWRLLWLYEARPLTLYKWLTDHEERPPEFP